MHHNSTSITSDSVTTQYEVTCTYRGWSVPSGALFCGTHRGLCADLHTDLRQSSSTADICNAMCLLTEISQNSNTVNKVSGAICVRSNYSLM